MSVLSPSRRRLLSQAGAAALTLSLGTHARAAAFPQQPIRIVVPFPAGGGTDVLTRLLMDQVAKNTGWTVVVDNRPGASGTLGLDQVAKAKPDGHTLCMAQTSNLAVAPFMYPKLGYDGVKSFVPVANMGSQPVVMVVAAGKPWKTAADVVAEAKRKSLSLASPGAGTIGHLSGEMFARAVGIQLLHVPYRGAGPALTDLMGGQTDVFFATPPGVTSLVRSGRLRALGVTAAKRLPILPDVPTMAEAGVPGLVAEHWQALVAPLGTPAPIVQQLNAAVNTALGDRVVMARLFEEGAVPRPGTPEQLGRFVREQYALWGKVVREANIQAD